MRFLFLSSLVALAACGGAPTTGPRNYDVVVEGSTSHFVGGGRVPGEEDAGIAVVAPGDAGGIQVVLPSDAGRVLQGSLDAGPMDSGAVVVPIPGLGPP